MGFFLEVSLRRMLPSAINELGELLHLYSCGQAIGSKKIQQWTFFLNFPATEKRNSAKLKMY
jgi:hypothetical protein